MSRPFGLPLFPSHPAVRPTWRRAEAQVYMFAAVPVRLWEKGAYHMQILVLCLTTLGSFAALFIAAKLIGHKQIAQLDFFDYITGITIGSIAAEMATELEQPWKPLTAILLYGGVTLLLSLAANKFPKTRRYFYGMPVILMDHGKLYRENLKKAKLDLSEFLVLCRQQGYFDLSDIQTAIFEYNGRLSILPVSTQRPATPADLELSPPQELTFTELIMDGQILDGNLKSMGFDLAWLEKQLQRHHIHSAREVFLAACDQNQKLLIYPYRSKKDAPQNTSFAAHPSLSKKKNGMKADEDSPYSGKP